MKLDDEDLLDILKRKEERAGKYVWGQLGEDREQALRAYYRQPYGNEEEGWSQIVASDVQDTVEWILPAILKTFTSTEKAVSFEPQTAADVEGADQATDTVNYVFYRQNNGFLILYTAIKDALRVRNCAVMWRKETKETVSSVPFKGATDEALAMLLQEGDEIESANADQPMVGPDGFPVQTYSGRIKRTEQKKRIKVDAFSPEDLLIDRDWTSPLLDECPYVARMMLVTSSDLKQMGFKNFTPDELRGSEGMSHERLEQISRPDGLEADDNEDDDALAEGWLRIEFVLVDADGDGIAERRCIYRLENKILKNEVVGHVPIATSSPTLNTHQWDGEGVEDLVGDLQRLHTELLRQTLNNLYLTNNPRTKVLTDANWAPLANIDDLLDSRPGGVIRQRAADAVQEQVTPFAAAASMPMLEYVQGMRENRTGVSRTSMGLNPDSLNNTATGRQIDQSAAQQRIELIARIFAETLLKPIFTGILKLLTDGDMEKIAFRLRDDFVEYDPSGWRDQYDMTINVGLGTGDKTAQSQSLQLIMANQMALLPMGLTTPETVYHTQAKMIENAGYKDVQNFLVDPRGQPPKPPAPNPDLQIEQMKQQGNMEKLQAELNANVMKFQAEQFFNQKMEELKAQAKQRESQMQLELQASNDMRDGERERIKAEHAAQIEAWRIDAKTREAELRAEVDKYKADVDASVKFQVEQMKQQAAPQDNSDLLATIQELQDAFAMQASAPRKIVRGPDGLAMAVDIGGVIKPIKRGADGRIEGI